MVLMAAASDDHRHHHHRCRHRAAKRSPTPPQPESPSPSPAPLDCFSFTWGVRRRLRCSKDGAPVTATALPSPPQHPATPSPDKEKPPQGDAAAGSSSRPQRSRYLRPLRYPATHPASRSSDAGAGQALHSPASAPPPPLTEPQQPRKRGFAVALTKQEIARDFAAVRCKRPSRRGKKRSKAQQAKIDALCPGFFLSTVDLDNYKIDDNNNR